MNYIRQIKSILKKLSFVLTFSQKKVCTGVFILTLIGAIFETLGVSIILPMVQAMITPDLLFENETVRRVTDSLGISTPTQLVIMMALGVVIIYIVKNGYLTFLSYIRAKFSCKIQREMAVDMMRFYMNRGYSFFLGVNTSELTRGVSGDISGVYVIIYQGFRLLAELLTVIGICFFIFLTDAIMAGCVVILVGLCLGALFAFSKKRMKVLGEEFRKYDSVMRKQAMQAFQGIKEVIVMDKQKFFANTYEKACVNQQKALIGQTVAAECPAYILEAVCVGGLILAVCIKILLGINNENFIAQLAAFAVAAFRIMPSLGRVSNSFNQIVFSYPSLEAVYSNIDKAKKCEMEKKEKKITGLKEVHFKKLLVLDGVSWKYDGREKWVLSELNLVVRKGEAVALIGQSGAGKTTVADIMLGLLRPQKGKVLLDGIDISSIPDLWSQIIGYVPQNVYLIDDTIRNNVAFGINENEISEGKVWDALQQAQLKEFIEQLPMGLDTMVGDRGIRLSGGQRQRIAIARALYFNPDILLLDEATSSLDSGTEEAVMEAIEALQGKKTLIIVAHRLTTIKNCDKVFEIKDGKAVSVQIDV